MNAPLPFHYIDLTHPLSPTTPSWDMSCGFEKAVVTDYGDCTGAAKFRVQKLAMRAGIGTHIDAPSHCVPNGADVDQLSLDRLIAPAVVINISNQVTERSLLSVEDVSAFEKRHGTIANGSFIIVYTGWERYWDQPERYRNNLIFPSVSYEAAELLCERNIVGLGIDTLSPDCADTDFPVHCLLLGQQKYIVENIACAGQLPPIGAHCFILPLKIEGATEAPVRLVGMVARP